MKQNLKNSSIVAIMALASGVVTFGLLDRNLFGADDADDPVVAVAWFSRCVTANPCTTAASCAGIPDDVPCVVCELPLTRMECEFFHHTTCNKATAPGKHSDCGIRWTGFCLSGVCFFDPLLDRDGRCARSWCI